MEKNSNLNIRGQHRRQNHSRSGRRSKSSMTHSELEFSSISTDSGTEMHSPPFRIQTYSNQAYVRSRSPSLTRLLELFRLLQNVLIFIKSFSKIKEVQIKYFSSFAAVKLANKN